MLTTEDSFKLKNPKGDKIPVHIQILPDREDEFPSFISSVDFFFSSSFILFLSFFIFSFLFVFFFFSHVFFYFLFFGQMEQLISPLPSRGGPCRVAVSASRGKARAFPWRGSPDAPRTRPVRGSAPAQPSTLGPCLQGKPSVHVLLCRRASSHFRIRVFEAAAKLSVT